jgi:hypothetical protein
LLKSAVSVGGALLLVAIVVPFVLGFESLGVILAIPDGGGSIGCSPSFRISLAIPPELCRALGAVKLWPF